MLFPKFQQILKEHPPSPPPSWFQSTNVQTLISYYSPLSLPDYPCEFQTVDLGDGDKLSLVITKKGEWNPKVRTVLLVHGLGGSHESPYMIRLTYWLYTHGFQVVRINLRGCGSGAGLARKPSHAGCSDDIQKVLDHLLHFAPFEKITLLGFSMGGNIVLKLAGEKGTALHPAVDSIGAVCPPIDLESSCQKVENSPWARLYEQHFVLTLKQQVYERRRYFPDLKLPKFPVTMSLRQFDDLYTAPQWGFQNAREYYQHAQAVRYMPSISTPTFILAAEDDPLVDTKPLTAFSSHPWIYLLLLPFGGHLGFWMEAPPPFGYRWMDWALLSWVSSLEEDLPLVKAKQSEIRQ